MGSDAVQEDGVVAGAFALAALAGERQPGERVEPVGAAGGLRDGLGQAGRAGGDASTSCSRTARRRSAGQSSAPGGQQDDAGGRCPRPSARARPARSRRGRRTRRRPGVGSPSRKIQETRSAPARNRDAASSAPRHVKDREPADGGGGARSPRPPRRPASRGRRRGSAAATGVHDGAKRSGQRETAGWLPGAAVQMTWRSAAERLRRRAVPQPGGGENDGGFQNDGGHDFDSFLASSMRSAIRLSSRSSSLADGEVEEGGDGLLHRAFEKRRDYVAEGRPARGVAGEGRDVHVAERLLLVADVAFFLEHPELGADRRVGGGVGEGLVNLGRCGPSAGVEDVHHLPLAAAQVAVSVFAHLDCCKSSSMLQK